MAASGLVAVEAESGRCWRVRGRVAFNAKRGPDKHGDSSTRSDVTCTFVSEE